MSNNLFDEIKVYRQKNKVSFFVGAGVSRLSGFPSWEGLVQKIADELGYHYEVNKEGNPIFSSEQLLQIPQMYATSKDKDTYLEKVEESFSKECSPNIVHDLILAFSPCNILTTNYDTLLEDTATKYGRNYSIINCDASISEVETQNYIVKVHGDFSSDFVLKEEDYLNYENNYKLVDNVVKTIFATNLVIFIGYSLNDYNIKLILNWVKNVQGSTFVKPIFIHTGNQLTENELRYFDSRGLRVIDCNDFTSSDEYLVKYRTVLEEILNYTEVLPSDNKAEILNYIYNKVRYASKLSYLRQKDFNTLFKNEYCLTDERLINNISPKERVFDVSTNQVKTISVATIYFEDFFTNEEQYKAIDADKTKIIKDFLTANNISGLSKEKATLQTPMYEISEAAFWGNFSYIKDFCKQNVSTLHDKMKKAYYLAVIGEYVESYSLYTEILGETKTNREWIQYYICQINRNFLFSLINQLQKLSTGFYGAINFGANLQLFSCEDIEKINREMRNFDFGRLFEQLPYYIKTQLPFLARLSLRNCYTDEYVDFLKDNYKNNVELSKHTLSMGVSTFDKIKAAMLDATQFTYDNMLLFWMFDEHKIYVKNVISSWLIAYTNDLNSNIDTPFEMFSNSRYKLILKDIVLISKTFKKDDIQYLESVVNLNNVPFQETKLLEDYLVSKIEYYQSNFTGTLSCGEIFMWKFYNEELKILLSICPYFIKNTDLIGKVITFICNFADGMFGVQDRCQLIYKWLYICDNQINCTSIFDNWMIDIISEIDNPANAPIIIERKIEDLHAISKLTGVFAQVNQTSALNLLSDCILYSKNIGKYAGVLFNIYDLFNDKAQKVLDMYQKEPNISQVLKKYQNKLIADDCESIKVIANFLEKEVQPKIDNKAILSIGLNDIGAVAQLILINSLGNVVHVEKYFGYNDEFDFLLLPEQFDNSKFSVNWILKYPEAILEHLKKNLKQKDMIVSAIERVFGTDSVNKRQMVRLFDVYKYLLR